jgi:hypothetical protein
MRSDLFRKVWLGCKLRHSKQQWIMRREQIESAVANGQPFALRMADGREYLVPHNDSM